MFLVCVREGYDKVHVGDVVEFPGELSSWTPYWEPLSQITKHLVAADKASPEVQKELKRLDAEATKANDPPKADKSDPGDKE